MNYATLREKISIVSRILGIRFLYDRLIRPYSISRDDVRKELLLNSILVGTLGICGCLLLSLIVSYIFPHGDYSGISLVMFSLITLFFGGLLYGSRKGYFKNAGYILVTIYFLGTLYGIIQWSFSPPMIILGAVLTITVASVVVSTRFGFLITLLIVLSAVIITQLQLQGTIPVELSWKNDGVEIQDMIDIGMVLIIISMLSWFSNRETEHALKRALDSEEALVEERNLLEIKVEERTRLLKEHQQEQVNDLAHFASLGTISSGIFHDLMNPLNTVISMVDGLDGSQQSIDAAKDYLQKAVTASRKMGSYLETVRNHMKPLAEHQLFSPAQEIQDALDLLGHKARVANVSFVFHKNTDVMIRGSALAFHQIVRNLIANAIDAYMNKDVSTKEKIISIMISKKESVLICSVEDFGCGIPEDIQEKIFEPFFTTKESHAGLGIGLAHSKSLLESEFKGKISMHSILGTGTRFEIVIPLISS